LTAGLQKTTRGRCFAVNLGANRHPASDAPSPRATNPYDFPANTPHTPAVTTSPAEPLPAPTPRPRGRPPKVRLSPAANALRHGILSTNPVIPEIERQEDWEDHLAGQLEATKPVGDLELALAHRIALTLWRLNRLIGFERYALRPGDRYLTELDALRRGLNGAEARLDRAFPTGSIEQVQRYEVHLHRLFLKDLHELEALQARRRGDPTPLARVEIN
jgi:hypothetical protein